MGEQCEPGGIAGPVEYGMNGGLRYKQRIGSLTKTYTKNIEHNVGWSLTNHLALLRAGRGELSWGRVEATEKALLFAENRWGKLGGEQVEALGCLEYLVYGITKNLCIPLRKNLHDFLHLPGAKSTLENYLKREATKRNLTDESEIVYVLDLNNKRHQTSIDHEIVRHYSVKKTGNLFLMHSPIWLKDVAENMYPESVKCTDSHYMSDPQTLETLKILWEGSDAPLNTLCRTAELL